FPAPTTRRASLTRSITPPINTVGNRAAATPVGRSTRSRPTWSGTGSRPRPTPSSPGSTPSTQPAMPGTASSTSSPAGPTRAEPPTPIEPTRRGLARRIARARPLRVFSLRKKRGKPASRFRVDRTGGGDAVRGDLVLQIGGHDAVLLAISEIDQ